MSGGTRARDHAGRALDHLIAETVFDYRVTAWPRYDGDGADMQLIEVPHFSTEIGDAWLIVEAGLIKNFLLYRRKDGTYTVQWGTWRTRVHGDTAPLAICLAAVGALGETP